MAMITWDISLRVGVDIVDNQHKKLVDLINRLYDAMIAGKGRQALGGILSELIDYTVTHFNTEENLFRQYGYPGAPDHIKEHHHLTKTAKELQTASDSGKTTITLDVMNFLKDWLVNHIMKSDKSFGPFLNAHGVK